MLASEDAPIGLAELGKFSLFRKKKKKKAAPPPLVTVGPDVVPTGPTPEQQKASSDVLKQVFAETPTSPFASKGGGITAILASVPGNPYIFWSLVGGGVFLVLGVGLYFLFRKKEVESPA